LSHKTPTAKRTKDIYIQRGAIKPATANGIEIKEIMVDAIVQALEVVYCFVPTKVTIQITNNITGKNKPPATELT